jgi:phage baseplate assembly protein W
MATVEQDTPEDVAQCVEVLLMTETGSRVEVPEYGVDPWVFRRPDRTAVVAACERWEPRAKVGLSVVQGVGWDEMVEAVTAETRVKQ